MYRLSCTDDHAHISMYILPCTDSGYHAQIAIYSLTCTDSQATPELAKQKCLEIVIELAVAYGSGEPTRVDLKPKKAELLQMLATATPRAVRKRPAAAAPTAARKRPAAAPTAVRKRPAAAESPQLKSDDEDTIKSDKEETIKSDMVLDQESEDHPAHKACRSRWIVLVLSIVCR